MSLYPSVSDLTSSSVSLTIAATAALIAAISSLSSSSCKLLSSCDTSSISWLPFTFPNTISLRADNSLVINTLSISSSSSICEYG